ncbi:hypothetical protein Syun_021727 [Stephania yunnanensis]|uniref:K Homology domain-containing protein n=1 Tax=Stephania yunnanensis TaxID=152371 RepID=A0AAP0IGX6_9MAGN
MRNMLPPANTLWSHRNSGFHGQPPMPWGGGFGNEFPRFGNGSFPAGDSGKASAEFSMKILCSADKIRAIIGKKGSNIKQIQQETGAKIHVEDSTDEADERVILVSCFDAPWNPRSPTIDAILRLLVQTYEFSEKGTITTRLLVPSNKVGCLLGQGGHIITEMRRRTQADIRVISKDGKPSCASADDELVQISGKVDFVPNALTEIASRLRVRSLEGVTAASELGPIGGPFQGFGPSEGFFDRGFPPPAMHGPGSSGGYERFKVAPREFEPRSFPVQPSGSGPTGYPNLDSSMEVKIPNSAINAVLGAGGSNISSISQITGAKVKLSNPQAGGSECIVEIHGSSDQMIAAQELLHNFISSAAAAQNYTAQLQQAAAASAGHNYNTQQQQNSYGTDAAQNYSLQYQQHSAHPSSTTNYGAHQQHASPYPSNVQSYGAQQQIASPCASVAQSYGAQKQQHASPYVSAVQTYGAQQQHASPYASAVQSYGAQQQISYATSAAHNYDAQQQNSHTQYGAAAVPQDTQHQQQQQQRQQQQQQQQQRTYSSAAVMYETQQQQGTYQN